MRKAYKKGLGVDFALVCQDMVKMVHSQVQREMVLSFRRLVKT